MIGIGGAGGDGATGGALAQKVVGPATHFGGWLWAVWSWQKRIAPGWASDVV